MKDIEAVLASHVGRSRRISSIDTRPSARRSSFSIDEVNVRFDDGGTIDLIAKAVDWDALSPEARRAKPPFVWDDRRELSVYEYVLPGVDVTHARYFGSYVDNAGVRHLLIERVGGVPLVECSEFEAWREAARWLARMHARVDVAAVDTGRAGPHLLRYHRSFFESWMQRARRFHEKSHSGLTRLAARHPRVVDRLLAERTTFIHGEFYSANILVDHGTRVVPFLIRPIDWEMAALGPALVDLACLVAGRWGDDERADVAETYFREVAREGGVVPKRDRYLETLDCCLIHVSVQNLGWSASWTPPPNQAHDWLADALRLCEKWQL